MAFGKAPLLQIDGQEVVETQAMIRYLAKRANLTGKTATDELYCDMIACNILDLIKVVVAAPFKRYQNEESGKEYINTMKVAWRKAAVRLEMCIEKNSRKGKIGAYLVGESNYYSLYGALHSTQKGTVCRVSKKSLSYSDITCRNNINIL